MLVKLPIFASLATLAVADFQVYWFSRQAPNDQLSWGANNYGGVKLFTSKPDPKGFLAAKEIPVAANLGNTEVSDSVGGGYMCDGCPSDKDWTQWSPERIQMNGQNIFFGPSGEHYITLYRDGGSYTIRDTKDTVHGTCSLVAQNKNLIDSGKNFVGLQAFDCKSPTITV